MKNNRNIKDIYFDDSYGICPVPITDKEFRDFIIHYLASDYMCSNSMSSQQVNTGVLFHILKKYEGKKLKEDLK